jgi:hypothetical protein
MCECVIGDVECELLAILGTHPFADVAAVLHGEGAAQAIGAHYGDEVSLAEKPLEIDVAIFVKAPNLINAVE